MNRYSFCLLITSILVLNYWSVQGQSLHGVYMATQEKEGKTITHELKFSDSYSTHTVYEAEPARFIKTLGGFYTMNGDSLFVDLEFNSDYAKDSVAAKRLGIQIKDNNLIINGNEDRVYTRVAAVEQDLDGAWLFGTRGPDTGQERRGDSRDRKTLKFLIDGRFQWIAYTIGSFRFSGTGGGKFTSENGKYVEHIEFFSRDNSRVGAELGFTYERQGDDWHHKGKNSKGEPMYEIWMKRKR